MKPIRWQEEVATAELTRLLLAHPIRPPSLEWRSFRTTAGRADYQAWRIELGAKVLTTPETLIETLRHEYAHLLAIQRRGVSGRGHGPRWAEAMRELGVLPQRTHTLPVRRNQVRQRVVYGCRRCRAEIPRARRLPRGRRYLHLHCGGTLQLERIERLELALNVPGRS